MCLSSGSRLRTAARSGPALDPNALTYDVSLSRPALLVNQPELRSLVADLGRETLDVDGLLAVELPAGDHAVAVRQGSHNRFGLGLLLMMVGIDWRSSFLSRPRLQSELGPDTRTPALLPLHQAGHPTVQDGPRPAATRAPSGDRHVMISPVSGTMVARPGRRAHLTHRDVEPPWTALREASSVSERCVFACRWAGLPSPGDDGSICLRARGVKTTSVRAVDPLGDRPDLLLDRRVQARTGTSERGARRPSRSRRREPYRPARASPRPPCRSPRGRPRRRRVAANDRSGGHLLAVSFGTGSPPRPPAVRTRRAIRGASRGGRNPAGARHVGCCTSGRGTPPWHSARAASRPGRRPAATPGGAALDVEETFRREIEAEPAFGDHFIRVGQRQPRRDDGAAAMRDVAERAAVHERRPALAGWTRFGISASRSSGVIAACAERSPARERPSRPDHAPRRSGPQRASRSFRSLESPRIAITSLAAVNVEAGLARDALRLAGPSDDDLCAASGRLSRPRGQVTVRPSIGTGAPEVTARCPPAPRGDCGARHAWMSPVK